MHFTIIYNKIFMQANECILKMSLLSQKRNQSSSSFADFLLCFAEELLRKTAAVSRSARVTVLMSKLVT